jgi:hypothetical protein
VRTPNDILALDGVELIALGHQANLGAFSPLHAISSFI